MTIVFVDIKEEPKGNKRFVAYFYNQLMRKVKTVRFGSATGKTYIDHNDDNKKEAWLARHSKIQGIDYTDPLKPSTLSRDILWNNKTLKKSIENYKSRFDLL